MAVAYIWAISDVSIRRVVVHVLFYILMPWFNFLQLRDYGWMSPKTTFLNGSTIVQTPIMRLLGVTLDKNLRFSHHVNTIIDKTRWMGEEWSEVQNKPAN